MKKKRGVEQNLLQVEILECFTLLKNIFHKGYDLLNIIYGTGLHLFLEICLGLQFFSKKVSIVAIFHYKSFFKKSFANLYRQHENNRF